MPKYIIESRNGNPAICELQDDGTYVQIAFGTGEKRIQDLLILVNLANSAI